jgi:hypothetical protein
MPHFPQLVTGAVSQYPVVRNRRARTVVNQSLDGHTVKLGDPEGGCLHWELRLSGLTDQEWAAIESLFHACEGGLGEFTFLDPADNLLSRSEDLTANEWQSDPLLQLTPEVADPLGTNRATGITNTSQTTQGISQSLDVPGDIHYCLSLYARGSQQTQLTLKRFTASHSEVNTVEVTPAWKRFISSGNLGVSEAPVHFGLEIQAGASVDVFGMQVEAQLGASDYKRTEAGGGVYANARFLDDSLTVVTEGSDQHSSVIRLVSALGD